MIINNITIKNFRGFKERYFEFDPHINVVLGDNTTGKTTLLHAVQIALGAFFKALNFPQGSGIRGFNGYTDVPKYMSDANRSIIKGNDKPQIIINALCQFYSYSYTQHKLNKHDQYCIEWIREYQKPDILSSLRDFTIPLQNGRLDADKTNMNSIFPVFLAFGSYRLDSNYLAPQKSKRFEVRLENAYRNALNDQNINFRSALNWLYRFDFNLNRHLEFENTDIAFKDSLISAIPAIKDITVDAKNGEFFVEIQMSKDPEPHWLTYDIMSDGFKSMINIVSDIAYRCIMLNGFLGENAVKETPGVVMIDEVDLFLHPHWQQHVLADLQKAFPKIQFIVTTHSPFIVQSVESKNVITLDGNKGDNDPNMRSIEDIAVTEMNMDSARFPKYNLMLEKAERYFELVKSGKENSKEAANVKKELDEIEEQFSSDPAYVALLRAERRTK